MSSLVGTIWRRSADSLAEMSLDSSASVKSRIWIALANLSRLWNEVRSMTRLILCSGVAVSVALLMSCSGDPTGNLRTGVEKLNPTPSQMFLQQGKTGTVVVSATDGQGNQVETAFAITNVGPGITVERDPTFRPVFVNDSQLAPPATDAMFRFRVTANGLASSSFTVTALSLIHI